MKIKNNKKMRITKTTKIRPPKARFFEARASGSFLWSEYQRSLNPLGIMSVPIFGFIPKKRRGFE